MCACADVPIDVSGADLNGMHAQIDLQATTGYKDFIFGGDATYDTAKQDVTKWATGVGTPHPIMPKHSVSCTHVESKQQSAPHTLLPQRELPSTEV